MCGVLGAVGKKDVKLNSKDVSEVLGHRGPDSSAVKNLEFNEIRVFLGHTRLAINDLTEAGAQPMESWDGRWVIVFNGEIYNHWALRTELDVPFRGTSDTETLVEALAKWGVEETVKKLNGIFIFYYYLLSIAYKKINFF